MIWMPSDLDVKPDGMIIHFWCIIPLISSNILTKDAPFFECQFSIKRQCMCHFSHTKLIDVTKQRRCGNSLKSDEERVTGKGSSIFLFPKDPETTQSLPPSPEERVTRGERKPERKRGKKERKQRRAVQYGREGGWERKSGNVRKERQNCRRRGGEKNKCC